MAVKLTPWFWTLKEKLDATYVFLISYHDGYTSIRIMGRDGNSFARAYIYHNNKGCVCLSDLYVSRKHRRNGLGKYLQEVREEIGVTLGCHFAILSVRQRSWMHEWYKSRGYKYYADDTKGYVFMSKSIS